MIESRLYSALEKIFPDDAPAESPLHLSGFQNETQSFQLAFRADTWQEIAVEAACPAGEIRIRQVKAVLVRMASYPDGGADCLRQGVPGLYPDRLEELRPHALKACPWWTALWIDFIPHNAPAGECPITLRLRDENGMLLAERTVHAQVLPGELPPQRLLVTRWFYCDGLARYYGAEPFSEEHWRLIENSLRCAVRHGTNMLLTPIHTPPLDTAVGHERMTTQLVDITVERGEYSFGMDKLRRWIRLARECGITHFEMAHLYTQWGAGHAPKIMATADGEYRRIFGWETPAVCGEYRDFLAAYIPAVRAVLAEEGVAENTRWHISDEPSLAQLPGYLAAKHQAEDLLEGCIIMDALSNFDFYRQGVVEHPAVATDHADPFLDANTPDLWVYYCCVQYRREANTFIAWPSSRNRIFGFQLFRHNAAGFLHWGWNFYNCMGSHYGVNPYESTDADCGVPAGDPFQVYPGADGMPEESIRLMVFTHAMQDLRACEMLSARIGREAVNRLIDETLGEPLRFDTLADAETLLALRQRINEEIRRT